MNANKLYQRILTIVLFTLLKAPAASACSILFFKDPKTGIVYVANNEDYWYDVKAYLKIMPETKALYARLWYGWNNFAQGGVNEHGLFFDGAVTPKQPSVKTYSSPKGNIGDEILATCKTVQEAVDYLETKRISLTEGHLLFGDKSGNAIVVEWVDGERKLTNITADHLMATNFLLADPSKGNYPCVRYQAMDNDLTLMKTNHEPVDLKRVGQVIAKAVQPPQQDNTGRTFGTLYSTFINLTDMEFKLVYKLDNAKLTQIDLKEVFKNQNQVEIPFEK